MDRPDGEGYVYFKFEPFVLHVMCATLSDAKLLVGWGVVLIVVTVGWFCHSVAGSCRLWLS